MQYKHITVAFFIQFTPCKTIYSIRNYLQSDMELQGQEVCKETELEKKLCTIFCMGGIHLPQMIIGWFEFEHMGLEL